jgi:MFS family permease
MRLLAPGLVTYAVLLGSLPFVTDAVALGAWGVAIGIAAGVVGGLPTAVIGDRVGPPLQGVAVGWLRTMTDTGHILGPAIMGALADAVHLSAPFVFAAAILLAIASAGSPQTAARSALS